MNVVILLGVSVGAVYAFLTMPGWLAMSINRGSLWKLRDEMFDARRRGDLPRVEAVAERIRIIELAIEWLPTLTPLAMMRMARVTSTHMSDDPRIAGSPAAGIDGQAAVLFAGFEREFTRILTRHFLTGSWSGIFACVTTPRGLNLLLEVATKQRFDRATTSIVDAASSASDEDVQGRETAHHETVDPVRTGGAEAAVKQVSEWKWELVLKDAFQTSRPGHEHLAPA